MAKEYLVRTKTDRRTQTLCTRYENPNLPDGEILEQPREEQFVEAQRGQEQGDGEEMNGDQILKDQSVEEIPSEEQNKEGD